MLTSEEVREITNTFSDDAWEWPMKRRANRKVVQALLKDRAEMQAEIERLRAVAEAAREMRAACPMTWTAGECGDATLEGMHRADIRDFVIRGVAGEFYPCKPDIFAATYEEATDETR